MEAKKLSTASPDDLQEFSGFPDRIRQIDLEQLIRLRFRLRLVKEEIASLEEQITAQVLLGCEVEKGRLGVKFWGHGKPEIVNVEDKL